MNASPGWPPFRRSLPVTRNLLSLLIALVAARLVSSAVSSAKAAERPTTTSSTESEAACQFCHAAESLHVTLPSGEYLDLTVRSERVKASVHGEAGLTCTDCHDGYDGYPHLLDTAAALSMGLRDYQLSRYTLCAACHAEQYADQLDSIHTRALAGGRLEAAVCTDCHGSHDVQPLDLQRSLIPRTCRQCHMVIYDSYADSVHGEALLAESNPDVPSCIDCHGVHSIENPTTTEFRLDSPELCASCHADPERMEPYGLSTAVLDTYLADFHGTAVRLFESDAPGQRIDQAVCVDCHGFHSIQSVDSPSSSVVRENLLATCQQCHPDASEHFPEAWASHYIPSRTNNRLVYYAEQFYATLLPSVGLVLAIVVSIDIGSWLSRILRKAEDV